MKVSIIGAGTMGQGIAKAFARNGAFTVFLCDSTPELAQKGARAIAAAMESAVKKGRLSAEDADGSLSRITPSMAVECAPDSDLVLEAAYEDLSVKKRIFAELDTLCKPDCIFATNTSSLSITEIGAGLKHPVTGMHFFNPADRMALVEVIAGAQSPEAHVETVKEIAEQLGKTPVELKEAPGFVVNRLLIPMINEAAFVVMEGVTDAASVDSAMKLGANHPMGPLELGDMIGLDVCLAIMDVLYHETCDSKYRACPLLRKMVRGGKLGCKSGSGFYTYDNGKKTIG